MKNIKLIQDLADTILFRKNVIRLEMKQLSDQSKICYDDNDLLAELYKQYNQYTSEFDLLTSLENFYSQII